MAKPPHIDGERGYLTLFFSLSKLPARYRYTTPCFACPLWPAVW
jgi:hypothetical protein